MSITMDQLVGAYVEQRDRLDAMRAEQKEREAPVKAKMERLEAAMQKMLLDQGANNMKTPHGTSYLQKWTSATVRNFDDTLTFIRENDRWDLLERKVNKTAVMEIGEVPGVEVQTGWKVNVRRS